MTDRRIPRTNRAHASAWAFLLVIVAALGACGRQGAKPHVTLYSSVDDALLREVVAAFEAESGVRVLVVGDTEATKTTGLVQRVIAERARPRADVWWSSEPFGTMKLAEEGLLEPYTSKAEADFGGSWPAGLRGTNGMFYSFAFRARVIVHNTTRVTDPPRRLGELTDPKWKGRIGMARPAFGTTRGQMGRLLAAWGEDGFRAWLEGLKANGVRLYDGNSAVVRGVAYGEIDVGLTDTDDVYAGEREGWPVGLVFEEVSEGGDGLPSPGPMAIPNTVAMVRGATRRTEAAALIDFILSEKTERLLAASDSHNAPIRPGLRAEFERYAIPESRAVDLEAVYRAIPRAMAICAEALGN